jgi:Family of unknown function (DUF6507)
MPSWDIQPDGVNAVLARTETTAKEFEPQLTSLDTGLQGSATESSSPIVAEALSGFAASAQGNIQLVITRTGAAMTGAANATTAYLDGDLAMAANAQAAAAEAPDPTGVMPGHGPR